MRYILLAVVVAFAPMLCHAQSADALPQRTSVHLLNSPYTWTAGGDATDTITVQTIATRGMITRCIARVDTAFAGIDSLAYIVGGESTRLLSYVPSALPGDDVVYQEWESWAVSPGDELRLVLYGISAPVTGQIRLFYIWQDLE